MVSEPMVMAGGVVAAVIYGPRVSALDPIITSLSPAARLTAVPLTVTTPPGVSVCDPIIYSVLLFAVMVCKPMVMAGGRTVVGGDDMMDVLEP